MSERPTAAELLRTKGALVGVEHLHELGLDDLVIDRVLYALPEIVFPDVRRVHYAAEDVRERLREAKRWP